MNQCNLSQVLRCRRRSGSPIDAPPTAALSHQPAMLGDAISVGTSSADIWGSAVLCRNRSCMTDALGIWSLYLRRRGCPMCRCVAIAVGRVLVAQNCAGCWPVAGGCCSTAWGLSASETGVLEVPMAPHRAWALLPTEKN
jgi:hypothetical protein